MGLNEGCHAQSQKEHFLGSTNKFKYRVTRVGASRIHCCMGQSRR